MSENLLNSFSDESSQEFGKSEASQGSSDEKLDSLRRDFLAEDFLGKTANIYEAVIVMSKRARQIGQKQARLIEQHMASKIQFSEPDEGEGEEEEVVHRPLYDDDEDAPKFPRFEKPTVLAMNELYKGTLKFEKKADNR